MNPSTFPLPSDVQPLLNTPVEITILLAQLGSPLRATREQAVHGLVAIGKPAVDPLLDYVQGRYRPGRNMAVRALGLIGEVRAIPLLARLLTDEDEIVRSVAAWALGEIGDNAAVPALINAARDQRQCVRTRATASLRQLGHLPPTPTPPDPILVRHLISQLSARSEFARNQAIHTLLEMGEAIVPTLVETLSAPEAWARQAAVELLRRLNADISPDILLALADDDPDPLVRQAATVLLRQFQAVAQQATASQL